MTKKPVRLPPELITIALRDLRFDEAELSEKKLEVYESIAAAVMAHDDDDVEPYQVWERVSLALRTCRASASGKAQWDVDAWKTANGYDDLLSAYSAAHNKVVELQAQLEASKAQAEWVAVSERLPEDGWPCVVLSGPYHDDDHGNPPEVAQRDGAVWRLMAYDELDDEATGIVENVTHWMPLPPPPSQSTPGSSDG